ncbi:MAG: hypothetical protein H8E94_00480 [Alphaproteobacteria bacterium]|nr:hypothetical protein [Alphaproteobacteria bacterium]
MGALVLMAWIMIDGTGHDFSYFLPKMLDAYLFFKQNGVALQEYTAAYCAGIFVFANPQSSSFSLPQLFMFLVNPVDAVRLTFVLSSVFGGAGIFLCARRFDLPVAASSLGAVIYMFSGFLIVRMMVGHLVHYNLLFAPLIAWLILQAIHLHSRKQYVYWGAMLSGAALIISYTIYAGIGVLLPQFLVVIGFLAILYAIRQRSIIAGIVSLAIAVGGAMVLSAPKIEASLALLGNFPRDQYKLPGFGPFDLLNYLAQATFYVPSADTLNASLQNKTFIMGWHEFYIGLTPFIAILLIFPLFLSSVRDKIRSAIGNNKWATVFVVAYLLLPAAFNLHTPHWSNLLESLPVIGQSSNMLRWSVLYIPLFALVAALLWKYGAVSQTKGAIVISSLIVAMTLFQVFVVTRELKPELSYNPSEIVAAWKAIETGATHIPPIGAIGLFIKKSPDGRAFAQRAPRMDHSFIKGTSNALCYEPIFGYRLEKYPFGRLRPGRVLRVDRGGYFNFKNPACYVYPKENGCLPGDHFRADQERLLSDFTANMPVSFLSSPNRQISDNAARTAFVLCFLALSCGGLLAAFRLYTFRRN